MRDVVRVGCLGAVCAAAFLGVPGAALADGEANPVATITSGPDPDGHVIPGPETFTFTSDQGGSTFECLIDGGVASGWSACTSPFTQSFADAGWHSVGVRAINDGRVGEADLRHFKVEAVPNELIVPPGPVTLQGNVLSKHIPTTTAKLLSRGVHVRARCNLDCTMTVRLALTNAAAKRANVQSPVSVRTYKLTAGTAKTVTVRLDPSPAAVLGASSARVHGLRAVVRFRWRQQTSRNGDMKLT